MGFIRRCRCLSLNGSIFRFSFPGMEQKKRENPDGSVHLAYSLSLSLYHILILPDLFYLTPCLFDYVSVCSMVPNTVLQLFLDNDTPTPFRDHVLTPHPQNALNKMILNYKALKNVKGCPVVKKRIWQQPVKKQEQNTIITCCILHCSTTNALFT